MEWYNPGPAVEAYRQQIRSRLAVLVPVPSLSQRGGFVAKFVGLVSLRKVHNNEIPILTADELVRIFDAAYDYFVSLRRPDEKTYWKNFFNQRGWEIMLAMKGLIRPATEVEKAATLLFARTHKQEEKAQELA